jgi:hypothetical protein
LDEIRTFFKENPDADFLMPARALRGLADLAFGKICSTRDGALRLMAEKQKEKIFYILFLARTLFLNFIFFQLRNEKFFLFACFCFRKSAPSLSPSLFNFC